MMRFIFILLVCSMGYGQGIINNPFVTFPDSGIDTSDLIVYYDFEQNGTDEMGNHNATVTGGTYTASGKIGYALNPDGTGSDYAIISDHNDFSFGDASTDTPFSVGCWVYFTDTGLTWMINRRDDTVSPDVEWEFIQHSDGTFYFVLFDGTNGNTIRKSYSWSPSTSTWYHVMGTYDGGGAHTGINIYVDGSSVGSSEEIGTYVAMHNTISDVSIATAGFNQGAGNYDLNGRIDLVQIWDRELTSDEVLDIYDIEDGGDLITD